MVDPICLASSGPIYDVLVGITVDITGSIFLTTLLISLILLTLAVGMRIPIEFAMILLLPVHLVFLACFGGEWLAIAGTILIYLGIILGKNIMFQ